VSDRFRDLLIVLGCVAALMLANGLIGLVR
jgi:hypothetical protein